ncbi:zinc finger lsd1 subclass family protein, putative, partial [Ichthyophthirius multifiliis]
GDKCVACPEGTFKLNNSDRICTKCMKGCISCTNGTSCTKCDKEICTSCDPTIFLQTKDSTCVEVCDSNQYLDTSVVNMHKCMNCNIICLTCKDAISCKSCADGKFLNTSTLLREECDNSCATCEDGTDKTKCLSCSSPLYLQQLEKKQRHGMLSRLLSEFFQNLLRMQHILCYMQKWNFLCLTCYEPQYLQTNETCADSCLPNEYPDITKTCQPCELTCLTCVDRSSCSTCADGMYLDSVTKYCNPCTTVNCKICDDNPSNQCTECDQFYYLTQDNKCVNNCQQDQHNTYGDDQRKCQPCNATCLTCSNAISCDQCNVGYYVNTKSGLCEKCNDNCQTCEDGIVDNQCVTCNNHQVLLQTKKCADNCDSKQYLDVNKICQQCDPSCNSCSNSNTCDTCVEGRYLEISTSKCELCDLNCKACIEKDKCQSCVQNYFLNQNKQCKQECDQQTFPDSNGICQPCPSNCLNCRQSNECTECFQEFYLSNRLCIKEVVCSGNTYFEQNQCKTECSKKNFKNSMNNRCDPCHVTCKKCTEANKCLECENELILNDDGKCEKKQVQVQEQQIHKETHEETHEETHKETLEETLEETHQETHQEETHEETHQEIYIETHKETHKETSVISKSNNMGEAQFKPKVAKSQIINVDNQVVLQVGSKVNKRQSVVLLIMNMIKNDVIQQQQNGITYLKQRRIESYRNSIHAFLNENKVYDCLPKNSQVVVIDKNFSCLEAINLVVKNDFEEALIWNQDTAQFDGIITYSDIVNIILKGYKNVVLEQNQQNHKQTLLKDLQKLNVRGWLRVLNQEKYEYKKLITVNLEAPLQEACTKMIEQKIHRILVIDNESQLVVGILTYKDILLFLVRNLTQDFNNDSYNNSYDLQIQSISKQVNSNQHVLSFNYNDSTYNCFDTMMNKWKISSVPITGENNVYKGLIHRRDIVFIWKNQDFAIVFFQTA